MGDTTIEQRVTRAQFEAATAALTARTITAARKALRDAKLAAFLTHVPREPP